MNKKIIREILISSYGKEELITLATDITGNAELVFSDGGTLESRARELVEWCGRRKKIQALIDQIKNDRPEIYKANEKKLQEGTESQLKEVQSAGQELEEVFGALRSAEIKKESISLETTPAHRTKHPLVGSQSSVHMWFKKLDPEQQVFVVSAALFSKLQKDELMSLYSNALKVLGVSKPIDEKVDDQNG